MATVKLTNNVKISEDSLETPKVYTVTKTNVTVGGRSDGSCTWYKHGNWVTMESRLIASGAKTYTLTNFIPEGYRPAYEVRTGINGVASAAVNMYGHVQLSTDGTVIIFSSGTGATETIFSITYWTSQSENGGSGGSSGGGSSGGDSGGSSGPSGWGFNSVLLWENPTPTASFGARTLTLDLSEYSHVQIVFLRVYNDSPPAYITNMYLVDGLKILESVNTGSNYNLSRTFFINTNNIVFEDGYCSNSGIAGSNVLIPYQIYGYNGDSTLPKKENEIVSYNKTDNVASVGSFKRFTVNGWVFGTLNFTTSSSATGTYTRVALFTGLPRALNSQQYGIFKIDGVANTAFAFVGVDGVLSADVREYAIASKTLQGYFMYPSDEASIV